MGGPKKDIYHISTTLPHQTIECLGQGLRRTFRVHASPMASETGELAQNIGWALDHDRLYLHQSTFKTSTLFLFRANTETDMKYQGFQVAA